jgi:NAD-dependent SIR2 family protein deacetylase
VSGHPGPLVVLAGAGLAAECGIPPAATERDWAVEGPRMQRIHDARPGSAHLAIRALQDAGMLAGVISETDDVLLEEAGIRDVVELAGSVRDSVCPDCGYTEPLGCLLEMLPVPRCAACGAVLEAGEGPEPDAAERAERLAGRAGTLLLVGARADHPLARRAAHAQVVTADELRALAG